MAVATATSIPVSMCVCSRGTHQPQAGVEVFDLLVDEAAELQLALLALGGLLLLGLCAFHPGQDGVKEDTATADTIHPDLGQRYRGVKTPLYTVAMWPCFEKRNPMGLVEPIHGIQPS